MKRPELVERLGKNNWVATCPWCPSKFPGTARHHVLESVADHILEEHA